MKKRRLHILIVASGVLVLSCLLIWRPWENDVQPLPSGPVDPVVSIGDRHGVIVAQDGSLWSWGGEDHGWPSLGRGQTKSDPAFNVSLHPIGTDTNWISVSAGQHHSLALKTDGTIWAWGANYSDQLGNGIPAGTMTQSTPVQAVPGKDWTQAVAGSICSYGVMNDGSLWAWGANHFGQLGTGATTNSVTPVRVGESTNWMKIAAGGVSVAGIQRDGSLWIWGGSPELGNSAPGSPQNIHTPTRINLETNWSDVSVAFNIWLGVKSDGTLWTWGRQAPVFSGASTNGCDTPFQIGTDTDWQACDSSSGGFSHPLRKYDGSFWVLSAPDFTHASMKLNPVGTPDDILTYAFGGYSGGFRGGTGIAITSGGEAWTWGTVLGQRSARDGVLEFLENLARQLGLKGSLAARSKAEVRDTPWRLRVENPK